jgi:hypothetical protein
LNNHTKTLVLAATLAGVLVSTPASLIYVAAHVSDAGEDEADDGKRFPSDLSSVTLSTLPEVHGPFVLDAVNEDKGMMAKILMQYGDRS